MSESKIDLELKLLKGLFLDKTKNYVLIKELVKDILLKFKYNPDDINNDNIELLLNKINFMDIILKLCVEDNNMIEYVEKIKIVMKPYQNNLTNTINKHNSYLYLSRINSLELNDSIKNIFG